MEPPVHTETELTKLRKRLDRERRSRTEAEKIAENGLRALYENQQKLKLLEEIAISANQASLVSEAMQFALNRVCAFTGWPLGHLYLASDDGSERRMRSTNIWCS